MVIEGLKLGIICYSLWLFCVDFDLFKDKKVICVYNIICDVENVGVDVVYEED